jgi:hypothetical protein
MASGCGSAGGGNARSSSSRSLIDILRTHPMAIIGGVLIENAFFTRPEDFIREVQARTGPTQPYRG